MKRPRLAADVLVVDVGNSKVAAARFVRGRLRARFRIATRGLGSARLERAWRDILDAAGLERGTPVVIASVVPRLSQVLVRVLRARRAGRPHIARWNDPWPFVSVVRRPERVGVDRLANLAGLRAGGHRSGIVVDAGTAITIDVLREARFEGGLILPGFDLQLDALHRHTALLPRLRVASSPPPLVGRDTAEAMRAGVWHTTTAGVAAIVRGLRALLPRRAAIRTTGSGAAAVALALGDPGCEDPDLQMAGLRLLTTCLDARAHRRK